MKVSTLSMPNSLGIVISMLEDESIGLIVSTLKVNVLCLLID